MILRRFCKKSFSKIENFSKNEKSPSPKRRISQKMRSLLLQTEEFLKKWEAFLKPSQKMRISHKMRCFLKNWEVFLQNEMLSCKMRSFLTK